MTLKKQIIINLGEGDFKHGFNHATVSLYHIENDRQTNSIELVCQIPKSLSIPDIYQAWQINYDALIEFSRTRVGFKKIQVKNVSIPKISECDRNTDILRKSLNDWLDPVKKELEQTLDINPEDEIEIIIKIQNIGSPLTEQLLQKIPWHWWDFLCKDNFTDVALSFSNTEQNNFIYHQKIPELSKPQRVKILCILGDGSNINIEADRRLLRKIPSAFCVFLRQPTRSEFFNFMAKERWDILFFSGHSKTDRDSDTALLYLNPEETLDIQEIRKTIKIAIDRYQGMKLAIFNSCDGLGLARQLADLDIAQIIVWREPVPDAIAQEFLKSFLHYFTMGLSLYRSVQKSRQQVEKYINKNDRIPQISWLPVIHHNLDKESITWQQLRKIPEKTDISQKKQIPRDSLLNRVEEFWIKGVLEKSLHIEETIELGLRECPEAVIDFPFQQQSRELPEGTRAVDVFGELKHKKTLLILGEPGSGKTTAVLEIARELIYDARQDPTLAIPVVLNLSSWAGETSTKTLDTWLVQELNRVYQFVKNQCKAWIKNQQLLLLLDGLDEVRESQRENCIRAINQFLRTYDKTEIVVCCRVQDYNKVSEKLQLQTAVFYQSPTEEQIDRYFDDAGEALSAFKKLKEKDRAIQELVKNPLELNLIAVAYKDKSIKELSDGENLCFSDIPIKFYFLLLQMDYLAGTLSIWESRKSLECFNQKVTYFTLCICIEKDLHQLALIFFSEYLLQKRRHHLFTTYIQRRFEEKQILTPEAVTRYVEKFTYPDHKSIYWLNWLAQRMDQKFQKVLLIEQIQPDWLPTKTQKWLYLIGYRLILGLIAGFISALHFGTQITNDLETHIYFVIPSIIAGLASSISSLMLSVVFPNIIFKFPFSPIYKFIAGAISGLIYVIIAVFTIYPFLNIKLVLLLSSLMIDGTIWGIFLSLIDRESKIGIIDTITIKKRKSAIYALIGLTSGLIYVLARWLLTDVYDINSGVYYYNILRESQYSRIMTEILIFTTLTGLLGLLDKGENLEQTITPNQGIWRSAKNACLFFTLFFPLGIVCSLPYVVKPYQIISIGLSVGLVAGLFGGKGSVFAGVVLIQHFTLRVILWWQGYIPWNYARFLNYVAERGILRKVGGGYIFIHRMLLEHFAQMNVDLSKDKIIDI